MAKVNEDLEGAVELEVKDGEDESEELGLIELPFTLEKLTLTRVDKFAGPQRYESKEVGIPFATFELGWRGAVEVAEGPAQEMMTNGILALMAWMNDVGMAMGKEVVAQIYSERANLDTDEHIEY